MTKNYSNLKEINLSFKLPTILDLLEKGVHFGHEVKRWNPKMSEYIYTKRGGIHIIDLAKTLQNLEIALKFLKQSSQGGEILFVGTKRQASDIIKEAAIRSGSHYIINRWAGGLLTNYGVVRKSIHRLVELEKQLASGVENRTKQEIAWMKKEYERLTRLYEGVKHLSSKPAAIVVVDSKRERIPVKEARKSGIKIVALADTNANPDNIDYIIPGNDDALGSIELIVNLLATAVAEGNEGKGVTALRKTYEAELMQLRETAKYEMEKQRVKKIQEKERAKAEQKVKPSVRIIETQDKKSEELKKGIKKTKKKVEKKKSNELDLKSMNLPTRILNVLNSAKVNKSRLLKMSEEDLLNVEGIGPKSVKEILKAVSKLK